MGRPPKDDDARAHPGTERVASGRIRAARRQTALVKKQRPGGPPGDDASGAPDAVRRAQRYLELVDAITAANLPLLPTMTEKYFRRMVIRMAEHQLLYEEYRDRTE